jgi:hypothetical protein
MFNVIKGVNAAKYASLLSNDFYSLYERNERQFISIVSDFLNEHYRKIDDFMVYLICCKFLECYLYNLRIDYDEGLGDAISVIDSDGEPYVIYFGYIFGFLRDNTVDRILEAKSDFNESLFLEENNLEDME